VAVTEGRPVRIGLVGYGKGGRFFHAPLIAAAPGCELAGVVARSAPRRAELERDHPGTPAYGDLAQLASAGVDAVTISTPADTHVPLTLEAVSLGLPVVCDKPFALQSAAARPVVEAAERAGVPLTVYQNRRWDADLLTIRAVIGSGELGRVARFESRIEQYAPPGGIPSSGGGILFDLGAHLVDQALLLFTPNWTTRAACRAGSSSPRATLRAWSPTWSATCCCRARRGPGSGCSAPPPATTSAPSTARLTS
jgi:predicted dehydrogenase